MALMAHLVQQVNKVYRDPTGHKGLKVYKEFQEMTAREVQQALKAFKAQQGVTAQLVQQALKAFKEFQARQARMEAMAKMGATVHKAYRDQRGHKGL